jgi:hypothetical protein
MRYGECIFVDFAQRNKFGLQRQRVNNPAKRQGWWWRYLLVLFVINDRGGAFVFNN